MCLRTGRFYWSCRCGAGWKVKNRQEPFCGKREKNEKAKGVHLVGCAPFLWVRIGQNSASLLGCVAVHLLEIHYSINTVPNTCGLINAQILVPGKHLFIRCSVSSVMACTLIVSRCGRKSLAAAKEKPIPYKKGSSHGAKKSVTAALRCAYNRGTYCASIFSFSSVR